MRKLIATALVSGCLTIGLALAGCTVNEDTTPDTVVTPGPSTTVVTPAPAPPAPSSTTTVVTPEGSTTTTH